MRIALEELVLGTQREVVPALHARASSGLEAQPAGSEADAEVARDALAEVDRRATCRCWRIRRLPSFAWTRVGSDSSSATNGSSVASVAGKKRFAGEAVRAGRICPAGADRGEGDDHPRQRFTSRSEAVCSVPEARSRVADARPRRWASHWSSPDPDECMPPPRRHRGGYPSETRGGDTRPSMPCQRGRLAGLGSIPGRSAQRWWSARACRRPVGAQPRQAGCDRGVDGPRSLAQRDEPRRLLGERESLGGEQTEAAVLERVIVRRWVPRERGGPEPVAIS